MGRSGTEAVLAVVPALALMLTLLAMTAAPVSAQEPRGLSAIVGGGYERGGPGPSLARSLDAAGLGEWRLEGSGHRVEYPEYYDAGLGLVVFLGAHYRFRGPVSVDAIVSNGSRGHAVGYGTSGDGAFTRILIQWSTLHVASTVGAHLGPVRLAAGPTLNVMFWDTERNWSDVRAFTTPVPGVTATATARIPLDGTLLSLAVGARAFATAHLAPRLNLPLETRYGSWFVSLTVLPRR